MSVNRPSESNSPTQPPARNSNSDPENSLERRVAAIVDNVFLSTVSPRQVLNSNTRISDIRKIKEELEEWASTQPVDNQANTEEAIQRIIKCYESEDDTLSLDSLGLTSIPNSALKKCEQLRTLSLENNKLKSFNGTGLSHLEDLVINDNQITEFDTRHLGNLKILYLDNNKLSSFIGINLNKLRVLHLNNNNLLCFDGPEFVDLEELLLHNNPDLQELPMSLGSCFFLQEIRIDGTGIPQSKVDAILTHIQNQKAKDAFRKLTAKIQLWAAYAEATTNFDFINYFGNTEASIIYEWLTRLERSADFKTNQAILAKIICGILKDLQNKEFKDLALAQMNSNNENCQDRAAMALNELYLSWKICCNSQDLDDKEKLELLVKAGKTLALRNAIADQLKERKDLAESVETYLFYEIILADQLGLLTCIKDMSYPKCAKDLDITALKKYIEENYLKEAAKLPIFDEFLKSNKKIQAALEKIHTEAIEELEGLGEEPQQLDKENPTVLEDTRLQWKISHGEVLRKRESKILQVKINYLRENMDKLNLA